MNKRIIIGVGLVIVVGFIAIQFIPYGHAHSNPPVQAEPKWDTPQTRELVQRSCFDCHSNLVVWPWYSNIAPVSWLVQQDVDGARAKLNFSEWNLPQRETRGAGRQVQQGEMPPAKYLMLHPTARLSAEEKQALINGLNATLAQR